MVSTSRLCQGASGNKKKTQTRRELEFIGMQQHVWLDMYTVTITHYKKGKEREGDTHEKLASLVSSLNMYRALYSLSSMPLLLILSALRGSLGRVTEWELWASLLHREETWTSKRGQQEKLKPPGPRGEETDCLSEAYQAIVGYMHSQAFENWY